MLLCNSKKNEKTFQWECSKQLTMQLVRFHQAQIVQHKQQAKLIIAKVSHHLLPESITNVSDIIANKIKSNIEELICELSLLKEVSRNIWIRQWIKHYNQKMLKRILIHLKRTFICMPAIPYNATSSSSLASPSVTFSLSSLNTKSTKTQPLSKGKDINKHYF